ncbi:MAG: hypothetical protein J5I47_02460, partial [Vicingus serpentipes]|nr:hypothetical protein [Vicingus serpentipes]
MIPLLKKYKTMRLSHLFFVLLFIILHSFTSLKAAHIAGGEFTYECLGGSQYRITFKMYRDCNGGGAAFPDPISIGVYNTAGTMLQTISIPSPGPTTINPAPPNPCTSTPTGLCLEVTEYSKVVNLPPIAGGYVLEWGACCRNADILNLTPNASGSFTVSIPDISIADCNSNPVFNERPPVFVCTNTPLSLDLSATDADGDNLVYSMCTPMENKDVPVTYVAPYNTADQINGSLSIDPSTGLLTGVPPIKGRFVIGVCVAEYRNGVLVSTTIRDFQFNVVDCNPVTSASNDLDGDFIKDILYAPTDCSNYEITFYDVSQGAIGFEWDFGDGSPKSTLAAPVHTYPGTGIYTVQLIAFSANPTCNDTVTQSLVVDTCRPCGMNINLSLIDGVCTPVSGCYRVAFTDPACSSGISSINGVVYCGGQQMPGPNSNIISQTPQTGSCNCGLSMSGGTITVCTMLNQPQPGGATANITGGTAPYTIQWTSTPAQSGGTATELDPGPYNVIVTDDNGCTEVKNFAINGDASFNLTASATDPSSCTANDGTLSANATGTTGTVNYSWQPGGYTTANVSNVPPGTYTVTVVDGNGCSKSAVVVINEVTVINVSANATDVVCPGDTTGSATVVPATGGTGPYTYTWNTIPVSTGTTVTGLSKNFYTVTATDNNGCQGDYSFTIDAPNDIVLNTSTVPATCFENNNGSATATPSGGNGGFTYLWTPGGQTGATASNLLGGTYDVTVTDAQGCTKNALVTVNRPLPLDGDLEDNSSIDCAGNFSGTLDMRVGGGTTPYNYSWTCQPAATTASISNVNPGFCQVTVTDNNGCIEQDTITVFDYGPLSVTLSGKDACPGQTDGAITSSVTGGTPPYNFSWDCSSATTQNISGISSGTTCNVTVTDAIGCITNESITIGTLPAMVLDTLINLGTCNNDASIDFIVNGGTAPFIYSWSTGDTTQDISGLPTDTIFKVVIRDGNICFDSLEIPLPLLTCGPKVTLVGDTICLGETGTITATGSGGSLNYIFDYTGGTITTPGSGTTDPSIDIQTDNPIVTTTYTVLITDNNGDTATATADIVVNPLPIALALDDSVCIGENVTLNASGGTTYLWTPNTNLSNPNIANPIANPVTTTNYQVLVTDNNSCKDSTTVTVTVNPLPTIVAPDAADCYLNDITLNASGGNSYNWTALGSPAGVIVSGGSSATPVV